MGVVIKWRMAILTLNVTAIFLARNITFIIIIIITVQLQLLLFNL